MLAYDKLTLENGLRVLVHYVPNSKVAVVNLMYRVGSGDEQPNQTGIAHLFEHLMFGASKHVPSYDKALEAAGGQSNAYTTFDVTNYHCVLPSAHLETAFWLESDRMFYPSCTQAQLEVQKKVVTEEFNQICHNTPYGDALHHLLSTAYKDHPYSWPTIGKEKKHIESIELKDIEAFRKNFYMPSNAVLVVAGGVQVEEVKRLSQKWFSEKNKSFPLRHTKPLTASEQCKKASKKIKNNVPFDVLYQAYHIPSREDEDYLAILCLAHMLGTGESSILYKELVHHKTLLTDLSVYTVDTLQGGLFVITAELSRGSEVKQVEEAIHTIIEKICTTDVDENLWKKTKNQLESEHAFSHMSLLNRANNFAFATWVRTPDFFDQEIELHLPLLQPSHMQKVARSFLHRDKAVTLHYGKNSS